MTLLFEKTKASSEMTVNLNKVDLQQFNYFLKGDISGIQSFIFDVKSEGAAKTLKGRSFFIQAISEICVELIKQKLGPNNIEVLYNGGGNFYIFLKTAPDELLEQLRATIEEDCKSQEIYLCLTLIDLKLHRDKNFGELWEELHTLAGKEKFRKFQSLQNAFSPFKYSTLGKWDDFTRSFSTKSGRIIRPGSTTPKVFAKGLSFFKHDYIFDTTDDSFSKSISNKLPLWSQGLLDRYHELISDTLQEKTGKDNFSKPSTGGVIEFEYLAKFAQQRTGTDKLGILKMDIDFLGNLFRNNDDLSNTQLLSFRLKWFFESFINQLLDESFSSLPHQQKEKEEKDVFRNNIYVVFSGGDDCFFLGAWDAIFEFALRLRNEFTAFVAFLKQEIPSIKKDITLSAGLLVVDPKFPVVRFAQLAEDAIDEAKENRDANGDLIKNAISVFGQVIDWEEYVEARSIAHKLAFLIKEKGESRAILERIKRSAIGFDRVQNKSLKGEKAPIWRLYYYLRNVNNLKEMESIIQKYTTALIAAFNEKKTTNPMVFPIAARWAEFLTRKRK